MIRTMVGSAFAGFQKAAVSGDYDEREIQLNNLRVDLRNLEGIMRQLMVELAATRQELQALKAQGGTVTAVAEPVKVEAPKAEPKKAKKEAAKVEAPKPAAEPVKVEAVVEAPKPAAVVEPVKVEAPKPAPVIEAPKAAPVIEAPKAEPAKAEAPQTSSFAALAAMAAAGGLKEGRHADDSSTDLEGYRERMRANGRDVTLATVGINYTADGVPFIGPVDNESSRAKAVGKVLTIDQWECISCGTCVEQTADVFTLPGEAKAEVLKQEGPMDLIQDAIDACPVTCISWLEREQLAEQHSAGGLT